MTFWPNQQSIAEYFKPKQWLVFAVVLITGLLLRWSDLSERPFHHDESLNSIYGKYHYDNPTQGYYKYDPLLHGPLLYNLEPFFYEFLGVSKWSTRAIMAFLGSLLILIPLLLFRHLFYPKTLLALTSVLAFSPGLVYWSRFVRHDLLVLVSMLVMFWSITLRDKKWAVLLVPIMLSLQWTTKENVFVTMAICLGYIIYELIFRSFILKEQPSILKKSLGHIKSHPKYFIAGVFIAAFIFCWFFSAGFKYTPGIIHGLYEKSFLYWFEQNSIERIPGPFAFQFFYFSWYEHIFILGLFLQTVHFYFHSHRNLKIIGLVALFIILILYFTTSLPTQNGGLVGFLKLKIPIDILVCGFLIVQSLVVTSVHLYRNERILAFMGYFFFATFFTYSYLGEKVPWLTQYPLIAGFFYLAYYAQQKLDTYRFYFLKNHRTILFIFMSMFSLRICLMTNFPRAGNSTEFISQVHTTKQFERIIEQIRDEILYPKRGFKPKILVLKDAIWPTTWYFHDSGGFQHILRNGEDVKNFDYVITSTKDQEMRLNLQETHRELQIRFRGWWKPNWKEMTFKNFLFYTVSHFPWNNPGHLFVSYYVKQTQSTSKK